MLFHIHTKASFDGILSIKYIINYCVNHDINILVICDHDNMSLVEKALLLGCQFNILVIPAIEYSTDIGDIIGLFIKYPCTSRNFMDILRDIKDQGGLSVLPHPSKSHRLDKIPFEMIDLIETFNSRCNVTQNTIANNICKLYKKPQIVGSDAHFPWELGLAINYFILPPQLDKSIVNYNNLKEILLENKRWFKCDYSNLISIELSQFIKGIKKFNVKLIIISLITIISELFNKMLKVR